tara:strand:- start:251 stop:364 length:114 start_codon:yes stop_codon:yes gene_type:complete
MNVGIDDFLGKEDMIVHPEHVKAGHARLYLLYILNLT